MQTIWKYPFKLVEEFTLDMPLNAEIVLVDNQPGTGPCIWARVDTHLPTAPRHFRITGTGQESPPMAWHLKSFQAPPFVWHLWGTLDSKEELDRKALMRNLRRREASSV